ncbi:MAG: rhomboid family intramembrane serine protease [Desulfuromonadales bacterium]|nr:rhomboid family intramembrane serine protease [Desulfuromonadales bacterium]
MDWKAFFDRLGMNGTRWQWRIMKWQRNLRNLSQAQAVTTSISVSKTLIIINVTLFALMVLWGMVKGLGAGTLMNPDGPQLHFFGAQYWPSVLAEGEWWRCITYAFTHSGLVHLGFNMVVLYQIGPMLEREIGAIRFIILYVLTALTATVAGLIWQLFIVEQWILVVGASGSLFGLIGFSISYFHRAGVHHFRNQMLTWAAFAFIFGIVIGADNAAHLGGGLGGALLGLIIPLGVRGSQRLRLAFNTLGGICIIATAASLLSMVGYWFTHM